MSKLNRYGRAQQRSNLIDHGNKTAMRNEISKPSLFRAFSFLPILRWLEVIFLEPNQKIPPIVGEHLYYYNSISYY